jgi:hypothetical protein
VRSDGGGGGGESVFTEPPGNPAAVRTAAARLRSEGERVSGLVASARSAHHGLVGEGHWSGAAASAFSGFAASSERLCAAAEQPVTQVAKAAETYADALETAQRAIRDARARYDAAQQRATAEADAVNNDPHATEADVTAAQARVDAAQRDAQAAVDDATRAWATYNTACQDAAREASTATEEVEGEVDDSPVKRIVEGSEPYREWNDRFHAVWDFVVADKALEALVKASETRLGGLVDIARGIADDRSLWSSQLSALQRLQEIGRATPANAAEADLLAQRLAALEAFGGDAASQARNASLLAKGLAGLSKGIGVTAIAGDVLTVLDPPDKGAMGWVDRGAAGVNGTLIAVNLMTDEIPVVGEVTIAATGVYLAGNYLYHHWGAFHDACDAVGHATVDAVDWVGSTSVDVAHDVADVASSAADTVSDVASDAWDGITSIF